MPEYCNFKYSLPPGFWILLFCSCFWCRIAWAVRMRLTQGGTDWHHPGSLSFSLLSLRYRFFWRVRTARNTKINVGRRRKQPRAPKAGTNRRRPVRDRRKENAPPTQNRERKGNSGGDQRRGDTHAKTIGGPDE